MLTPKQVQALQKSLEDRMTEAMVGNVINIVTPEIQASNSGVYNTCAEIQNMIRSAVSDGGEEDDEE